MKRKLGEILVRSGAVTEKDIASALSDQNAGEPNRLGDLLVELGKITPTQLARALSTQHDIPFVELPGIPEPVLALIPLQFQQQHRVVPFRLDGEHVFVAMADPSNAEIFEDLRFQLKKKITVFVAAGDEIDSIHTVMGAAPRSPGASPPIAPRISPIAPAVAPASTAPSADDLFGELGLSSDSQVKEAAKADLNELFSDLEPVPPPRPSEPLLAELATKPVAAPAPAAPPAEPAADDLGDLFSDIGAAAEPAQPAEEAAVAALVKSEGPPSEDLDDFFAHDGAPPPRPIGTMSPVPARAPRSSSSGTVDLGSSASQDSGIIAMLSQDDSAIPEPVEEVVADEAPDDVPVEVDEEPVAATPSSPNVVIGDHNTPPPPPPLTMPEMKAVTVEPTANTVVIRDENTPPPPPPVTMPEMKAVVVPAPAIAPIELPKIDVENDSWGALIGPSDSAVRPMPQMEPAAAEATVEVADLAEPEPEAAEPEVELEATVAPETPQLEARAEAPPEAAEPEAAEPEPEPDSAPEVVEPEVEVEVPKASSPSVVVDVIDVADPEPESLPSLPDLPALGATDAPVARTEVQQALQVPEVAAKSAPATHLKPDDWTGLLEEVPSQKLLLAVVKALIAKGRVSEEEIVAMLENSE